MAQRDPPRRLQEISRVRDLQSQIAEAAAARAAADLNQARSRRDRGAERLGQDHACWTAALARPSVALELVGAWTAAVDASRTALGLLETRVADAEDLKAARLDAWRAARAQERQARQMERSARRRVARAREETLLAQAADHATQKSVGR
jgi:hypothetical protein